jgi:hypothetical protein
MLVRSRPEITQSFGKSQLPVMPAKPVEEPGPSRGKVSMLLVVRLALAGALLATLYGGAFVIGRL